MNFLTAFLCYFTHANVYVPIGKLKYIINSPQMHIWHHSIDIDPNRNVNYGSALSMWDWLYGTAYTGRDSRRPGAWIRGRGRISENVCRAWHCCEYQSTRETRKEILTAERNCQRKNYFVTTMRALLIFVLGALAGQLIETNTGQNNGPGIIRLNHVGIAVNDMDESAAFYSETMGFERTFSLEKKVR